MPSDADLILQAQRVCYSVVLMLEGSQEGQPAIQAQFEHWGFMVTEGKRPVFLWHGWVTGVQGRQIHGS
jgi:hypothetical protein